MKRYFLMSGKILLPAGLFALLFTGLAGNTPWMQQYMPVAGSLGLSSLAALLPAVVLFVMLVLFRRPSHQAALASLGTALLMAVFLWGMPLPLAVSSMSLGMATGLFPIFWTLVNAVWIFNMLVDSGRFDTLKESLRRVSYDRRVQTLLIGFGFIGLLESMAAFGAPIAIGASMLMGLGFSPILSGTIALLADTAPSAWGTQGMPLMILHSVTDIDLGVLGAIVGRQTPLISFLLPLVLVFVVSGWKGLKGIWGLALGAGAAYAMVAAATANFLSPLAAGVTGAIASILAILGILQFWHPKKIWIFPEDSKTRPHEDQPALSKREVLRSWSPYVFLVLLIGLINGTALKELLERISTLTIQWPGLHELVLKTAPVVSGQEAYGAVFQQALLSTGGTVVFLAGILAMVSLKVPWRRALALYGETLKNMLLPGITIISILGIAYLMNYSGMTYTIGLFFASFDALFPLATVFLGVLGCTLGGSVAGSNALFGNLVVVAGNQIGVDPGFSAATLCSGGTMGKAFTPQNLVIANSVIKIPGLEGKLLKRVFIYAIGFSLLLAGLAMVQYHLLPWTIQI